VKPFWQEILQCKRNIILQRLTLWISFKDQDFPGIRKGK